MRSAAIIRGKVFGAGLLGILLCMGCGGRKEPATPAPFDSAAIVRTRLQKDQELRTTEGSPIPVEQRETFGGLRYYPPSREMVFDLTLEKISPPQPFKIAATKGDVRMFHRYGKFTFTVDGHPCTLTAFMSEEHPGELFVPFKDATNGTETYEVGRYLDLEERKDGRYVLDFNQAYNPFCAYNSGYTCPIVPAENILQVPIRAGEKLPSGLSH